MEGYRDDLKEENVRLWASFICLRVIFFSSWGGVRMNLLGTSTTIWPIVPAPDDR
jgi:hypothetical protein